MKTLRSKTDIRAGTGSTSGALFEADLLLAEKFGLAVALTDIHAKLHQASSQARSLLREHPALVASDSRIGLMSHQQSNEFRIALRYVFSGQPRQTIRADDGCMGAPLALQISSWRCKTFCLVSFQPLAPQRIDLSHLSNPFDLTARQLRLLELFSQGLSLAEIAQHLKLKPQTIREAFCQLYGRFDVRNQLELLSALQSPALTASSAEHNGRKNNLNLL